MGTLEPETFGEIAQTRNNVVDNVEGVVMAVLGITLLIAGCSLAVTVGGGLVERKRPFTLLRVSGAPMSTLFKVVVQESALPLASAAAFAATSGLIVAALLTRALIPAGAHLVLPGRTYYLSMGAGLAVSLLVTSATLPLLARLTEPSTARFE